MSINFNDFLAQCCSQYRRKKRAGIKHDIGMVLPEDYKMAADISEYYSKKITILFLKGKRLTLFREDLQKVLTMGTIPDKQLLTFAPLISSLPKLYEFDIKFEGIKKHYETQNVEVTTDIIDIPWRGVALTLMPVDFIHRKNKTVDDIEYWFKTASSNVPVMISVGKSNILISILDKMFKETKELKVVATCFPRSRDDFFFFQMQNFTLSQ